MAGLADIPVGYVKIITGGNGILNSTSAHIAYKGFHIILLIIRLTNYSIHQINKKVEGFKDGI
jgi:hypothetical protein